MDSSIYDKETKSGLDTVSLGMVVIDKIRLPSQAPMIDIVGGSGAYATLGSRLFTLPLHPRSVGCLVLAGHDFPDEVRDQLVRWQVTFQMNILKDKLSTRGLIIYEDDTFGRESLHFSCAGGSCTYTYRAKTFRYTTPPLKASPWDLVGTDLLESRAFHILATPEEIEVQIPELHKLRQECGFEAPSFIVWEPFPAACTKHNKNALLHACRLVDVFSPHHREMSAMFEDGPSGGFDPTQLEDHAQQFCKAVGPSAKGIVIVRAGEHGSLTSRCHDVVENVWLPPFYQLGATKVVDPTSAGNAFLGGFMQGWITSQDIREASMYGIVAASLAIEQIGMPRCQVVGQEEFWNGVNVRNRLEEYKARVQNSITGKRMECFQQTTA